MRFTFGTFVLSPGHRVLLRDGHPVRLIPKYFDLLVLLVAERRRAVTRQEIFDRVWTDVVVSGTPVDLTRLIESRHPVRHATYELDEIATPTLADVLAPVIALLATPDRAAAWATADATVCATSRLNTLGIT